MAVSITLYNHTPKLFANGEVSLADLKFMLLDDNAAFDAADVDIDDVAGSGHPFEVAGFGWDVGGELIENAAVTTVTTNDAKLDADDVEVTATGGAIGPASFGVIYDSDSGKVLAFVNFDGEKEAGEGTDFKVIFHASGIVAWTYA